jgi:hypothetical protein
VCRTRHDRSTSAPSLPRDLIPPHELCRGKRASVRAVKTIRAIIVEIARPSTRFTRETPCRRPPSGRAGPANLPGLRGTIPSAIRDVVHN